MKDTFLAIRRHLENSAAATVTIAEPASIGRTVKIAFGVGNQIAIRIGAIVSPAGERMEGSLAAIRADLKDRAQVAVAPDPCHAKEIALGIHEQAVVRDGAVTYAGEAINHTFLAIDEFVDRAAAFRAIGSNDTAQTGVP